MHISIFPMLNYEKSTSEINRNELHQITAIARIKFHTPRTSSYAETEFNQICNALTLFAGTKIDWTTISHIKPTKKLSVYSMLKSPILKTSNHIPIVPTKYPDHVAMFVSKVLDSSEDPSSLINYSLTADMLSDAKSRGSYLETRTLSTGSSIESIVGRLTAVANPSFSKAFFRFNKNNKVMPNTQVERLIAARNDLAHRYKFPDSARTHLQKWVCHILFLRAARRVIVKSIDYQGPFTDFDLRTGHLVVRKSHSWKRMDK